MTLIATTRTPLIVDVFDIARPSTAIPEQVSLVSVPGAGFAAAWNAQGGTGEGLFLGVFDAEGRSAVGPVLLLADSGTDFSSTMTPDIVRLADGGFVAAWEADDSDGEGVFARIVDGDGTLRSPVFRLNRTEADDQEDVSLAPLDDGGFRATWTSDGQDGAADGIFARDFGADGTPRGPEVQVNPDSAGIQSLSDTATLRDGTVVTAFLDVTAGFVRVVGGGIDLLVQDGGDIGRFVNTVLPSVVALPGGGFAVGYRAAVEGGAGPGSFDNLVLGAKLFDADGAVQGDFTFRGSDSRRIEDLAIAALPDDGLVAAWGRGSSKTAAIPAASSRPCAWMPPAPNSAASRGRRPAPRRPSLEIPRSPRSTMARSRWPSTPRPRSARPTSPKASCFRPS